MSCVANEGESVVDYRGAFAAIRQDPKWLSKIALGVLINFIPYVGAVWLLGWQMEYQRAVAWGLDERLPGWSNFSGQAMQGLRAYVAILPYSLVLSLVMVPFMLVVPFIAGVTASSDPANAGIVIAISVVAGTIVLVGGALLLMPLSSAVILRVGLYGTFESGFQLKETWRLMKEGKSDLLRAWGYGSANVFMMLIAVIAYFGLIALVIVLIPGTWDQKSAASLSLVLLGYFAYILLGSGFGLYLGLVNVHYFGTYGRTAYRLGETGVVQTTAASEKPAQTAEGTHEEQ